MLYTLGKHIKMWFAFVGAHKSWRYCRSIQPSGNDEWFIGTQKLKQYSEANTNTRLITDVLMIIFVNPRGGV
jgi:hypothetical protein